jgi:signal transduction histidine kinase
MADEGLDLERQAAHLELVSRWADDLAHEVKNPLHAMVINLELVKRRAGAADAAATVDRAEVVETELHRVHALIDSLLRIIRPWPETTSIAVDDLFQSLRPVFSARARIRKIDYRQHEPCGAIAAMPPADLALVVVFLVDRALESVPEGGVLETRCERIDDRLRITVAGEARGAGSGRMAPSAGAALAIPDRLVRKAGGTLDADPERGDAVVTLPLTTTQ